MESMVAFDESTRALGRLIRVKAHEIEERWLAKITAAVAHRDVELSHLRDGIPDYLAAIAKELSGANDGRLTGSGAAIWSRVARHHGITRVRIGFDIDQLIHEFVVLRWEIRAVAIESGVLTPVAAANLADLIEAAIVESVRAYVGARDFEMRRVQAEHVGFLTHELRNPLATAVAAASALRDSAVPEQTRALDALDRSHARLSGLIDSVLDAERLQAGQPVLRIEAVREHELLDKATEAARKVAHDKGLTFETELTPDRIVEVDGSLTSSAIQNLVDNAVKYTDEGTVMVSTDEDESNWFVHVRDTCPGLSEAELQTIFEPFRRGTTTKKGTGLGLSIARRAIEAQGGTVKAESPGPSGCHFWITLPRLRH